MIRKRFFFSLFTLVLIAAIAVIVAFLAKGYRFSPEKRTITGTGIISVNSTPDQASVYLDGHLTTSTNDKINYLTPKTYTVKIVKEGYIPWEKQVNVKEGLVSEIKATLYRAIPTVYPLTYSGVSDVLVSPDGLKMIYFVPDSTDPGTLAQKKSGLWVWPMSDRSISFGRTNEPRQIGLSNGVDFTKATYRWSPDSTQILVSFPDRNLLYDSDKFNDPPKDVTPLIQSTLKTWTGQENATRLTKLQAIKDLNLRKTASESAILKWSTDDTKILLSQNSSDYQVIDLINKKTFNLPKLTIEDKTASPSSSYNWLPDSEHLVLVENLENTPVPVKIDQKKDPNNVNSNNFPLTKISIIETDGFNKSEIYVGNLDPRTVVIWPDGTRLVTISSLPTATASKPNLYGINLK